MNIAGGLSVDLKVDIKVADDILIDLCAKNQSQVEAHAKASYEMFKPISYRTQNDNGTKYITKIQVGTNEYIHATILEARDGGHSTVTHVEVNVTLEATY